jgi:hypothetical protein
VTGIRRFLGAVLIAGSSTQCLLFAESPNVQPKVDLEGPAEVHKNGMATFNARVTDDQGPAGVRYKWFRRKQACPASLIEAEAEQSVGSGDSYIVDRPGEGALCVGVVATDSHGASGFTARRFDVVNQRPVARLTMLTPGLPDPASTAKMPIVRFPLYSEVKISGSGSDDPDDDKGTLRFQWKVTWPAGTASEPSPCGATTSTASVPDGQEICRRLDVAGDYTFELTVRDGQSESEMPATMTVVAKPDGMPCFERTEPPHDLGRDASGPPVVITTADRPYTFRVLQVNDDGDPYPTPSGFISGSFAWWWRLRDAPGGEFKRVNDATLTSLTFEAGSQRPGDEIEVWVDYRDRQPSNTSQCVKDALADRCQDPARPDCFQRVSWRLRFIQ